MAATMSTETMSTLANKTPRPRAVVMADVAKLAGVSLQTVSRVINDSPHVRAATRQRVEDAMRKLEYRPNPVARALVTGRSRTLGVVSFDTTLFGPASTLFGIERAAHDADYFVSIVSLRSLDRASVMSAVERLRAQGVDGILVIAPQESASQAILHLPQDVPVVAAEAGPGDSVPLVAVDQVEGARLATQHLLDLGHRTVHHVAGPDDSLPARSRIDAWRATLQAAGRPVPEPLHGDWTARTGYAVGRELAADPDVTAVFCANDETAAGVLHALHETGRRVPEDVSVVGFDGITLAEHLWPPLTTVEQDFARIGSSLVDLLLRQVRDDVDLSGTHETVPVRLAVRQSTGPAPR
jgi:DNA-binding LacI/PurR family transcriptional regulator